MKQAIPPIDPNYGLMLWELMRLYTKPIVIGSSPQQEGGKIVHHGAITFVNTGKEIIGITAKHVLDSITKTREALREGAALVTQVGGEYINLEKQVIDQSTELDLATLKFTPSQLKRIGGTPHTPRQWPPEAPNKGSVVVMYGQPAELRAVSPPSTINFGDVVFQLLVTSVAGSVASILFEREYWVSKGGLIAPRELKDISGMSGTGVFIFDINMVAPQLCATLIAYNFGYEIARCRLLSCVDQYGKIMG